MRQEGWRACSEAVLRSVLRCLSLGADMFGLPMDGPTDAEVDAMLEDYELFAADSQCPSTPPEYAADDSVHEAAHVGDFDQAVQARAPEICDESVGGGASVIVASCDHLPPMSSGDVYIDAGQNTVVPVAPSEASVEAEADCQEKRPVRRRI